MKTSLSAFLCFFILLCSCTSHADKNSQKFTLQGEMKGQDSGIIQIGYIYDNKYIIDTAEIKNGNFTFTGFLNEPTQVTLRDGNHLDLAVVYLESRKMTISIVKGKTLGCKMTGSKTQTEFDLLNQLEEPINERLSEIRTKRNIINDSIKNSQDGTVKLLLEKKREEFDSLWLVTRDELDPIELKFVLEHPKSFITPFYLRNLEEKEVISIDSVRSIFNGLDYSLKISKTGKLISEDLRKKENVRTGNQSPDFKATDLNEQTVILSQFKGKNLVLLEFWASWCSPCQKSIPELKVIYNKYHEKGLEIIAVSVDEKRDDWVSAVKNLNIDKWYNIQVAEKWPYGPWTDMDIYSNYYYKGVPYQILIDKNGKIIDRYVGDSKENEESLDSLLSQIFYN